MEEPNNGCINSSYTLETLNIAEAYMEVEKSVWRDKSPKKYLVIGRGIMGETEG